MSFTHVVPVQEPIAIYRNKIMKSLTEDHHDHDMDKSTLI